LFGKVVGMADQNPSIISEEKVRKIAKEEVYQSAQVLTEFLLHLDQEVKQRFEHLELIVAQLQRQTEK
jgi:hypothetical protein